MVFYDVEHHSDVEHDSDNEFGLELLGLFA